MRDFYKTVTLTILQKGRESGGMPKGKKNTDRKRVMCPLYPKRNLILF